MIDRNDFPCCSGLLFLSHKCYMCPLLKISPETYWVFSVLPLARKCIGKYFFLGWYLFMSSIFDKRECTTGQHSLGRQESISNIKYTYISSNHIISTFLFDQNILSIWKPNQVFDFWGKCHIQTAFDCTPPPGAIPAAFLLFIQNHCPFLPACGIYCRKLPHWWYMNCCSEERWSNPIWTRVHKSLTHFWRWFSNIGVW